tara:strand:+ start:784 stop:1146 length:363 start_codon:yes stop_codon:yes gene_type:complete
MRDITLQSVRAFLEDTPFDRANMTVQVDDHSTVLELHGNAIVWKINKPTDSWKEAGVYITTCGWNSRVTTERLNGIPGVHVYYKMGQLYCNGEPWDGSYKKIEYCPKEVKAILYPQENTP